MPFAAAVLLAASSVAAPDPRSIQTPRRVTRLAEGVYAIEHADARDGFAGGNTTVIIGNRQVFVVDAGFLPSDAREDIVEIRRWTNKPVSFLLDTHFHNDHNLTNRLFVDAFPGLTIIAHVETKRDMDLVGPGSAARVEEATAKYRTALATGKLPDGRTLTAAEKAELESALARRTRLVREIKAVPYQSPTLTYDHDFTVDLGDREVEVKFLGRGNTAGDAVVFLPKEKIAVVGDLLVHPIPYIYDGYPSEWARTLDKVAELGAGTIVPGHGPVLHDRTYLLLVRDLLQSAVDQINAAQRRLGPAMFRTLEAMKATVDLTPFRRRFAGGDKDLGAGFDDMTANLVKVTFTEAGQR